MTRPFNQIINCPHCNEEITAEPAFGRWIRNNPELDSYDGYCVIDQDYWVHEFSTYRGKDFQLIMMVEIKTFRAMPTLAQKDTLHVIDQITRNRRNGKIKQAGNSIQKVYSYASEKEVYIRSYGAHLLTFSHSGPDDSDWIKWNQRIVSEDILTKILRFDLDPDTLKKIDLRYHHIYRIDRQPTLFPMNNEPIEKEKAGIKA